MRLRILGCTLLVAQFLQPAWAQEQLFKTLKVEAGTPARVAVHINLKPDCTPGPLAEIKVRQMPTKGTLLLRRGKANLKRGKCQGSTPAQALFYMARAGYTGPDKIEYEVTTDAVHRVITIAIEVGKATTTSDRPDEMEL
jgi:hypothetical protein